MSENDNTSIAEGKDEKRRPSQERLEEISADIREHGNLGEMMLIGDLGFHTFYDPARTDYGIGTTTAMHVAFDRTIEELWLDANIVEDNHGEVTPETVVAEAEAQLEDFVGRFHFFERFSENLKDVLHDSQERYGEWESEQAPLDGDRDD